MENWNGASGSNQSRDSTVSRNRLLLIIGTVILVLLVIIFTVVGWVSKKDSPGSTGAAGSSTVTVKQLNDSNISRVKETLKRTTADQVNAKAAITDSYKRIDVGN